MDPRRPDPRTGAMTELEAKLLAAGVAKRLFNKQADPVELGRYRVLERLGQGGMGVVFRAHDPQLRRDVALKLLHARGGVGREQQARLRREALALGRLSHPNVVQVFEVGEVDEHMFVVMELVRGTTLRAWLGERARSVAEVVAIAGQVGRGLAAAHAAGIVHRDLKPENVLVGEDGRARVVDFGLARAMDGGAVPAGSLEVPLTKTGTLLGTPAFMAPEQVRDPTSADARSDQFSFCVLVYEALYGERPFVERGSAEASEIRAAPAGSAVPMQLRAALLRGLQGEPERRWPSMAALIAALEAPVVVTAPRRWIGVLGGVVAIAVVVALAVPMWLAHVEERERALRIEAVSLRLAGMVDDDAAAERALAGLVEDRAVAAAGWARWARLLSEAGRSPRSAWGHVFVFGDATSKQEALLGLARDGAAEVIGLIEEEAPALLDAPEVAALRGRAEARVRGDRAASLAMAGAPREVVALARAGLVEEAAATLRTLVDGSEPAVRRRWQLALADLVGDEEGLRLLAEAARDPSLQAAARGRQVTRLMAGGRLEEAAEVLAGDPATSALKTKLAEILAARAVVPLRFSGIDAGWTELVPSAVRGDADLVIVDGLATEGTIVAWGLEAATDRVIVEWDVAPRCMAEGTGFVLRVGPAELGIAVVDGALRLRCGAETAAIGAMTADGSHAPLALRIDVDGAAGEAVCRVGETARRGDLADGFAAGPLRVELRGGAGGDPACARIEWTRIAATGARLVRSSPSTLALAGASLVDDDPQAAARLLAGASEPQAGLWRAIAAARLGRWQDAQLTSLLADPRARDELQQWLRNDPRGLAPGLRQMLGEPGWLGLFAETWRRPLESARWSPTTLRVILGETDGLVSRCSGPFCAPLLRARGRALLQVGERAAAQRALEAALAVVPADAEGRALASRILVDLTMVKSGGAGERD